jgi:class 3 adenylate cyclase/tetratricopeptide (TPR) repeat protein
MGCAQSLFEPGSGRREERKVVSVLFCDLVGFTASAHAADPEDVSRSLTAYHLAVREEIERFGGVVEKFIGDAVVGVWGAPQVHEDDAERAVRAGLAIVESAGVEVRVGVNTGEALVRVSPASEAGQGMAVGDVMNTASRLQAVAPVGGVVAGEATVRATRDVIDYESLPPVTLKGKPAAVEVWRAVAARDASGVRTPGQRAQFVGRIRELRLLRDVFERAVEEPGLQLVTVVGEPGIGKSRLVAELEAWLSERPAPVAIRRGRCIAYGDGIGLWPLAEIVKAHAGISETVGEQEARALLDGAVEGMAEAAWLRARLAPLVGLPGEGGEREEMFAAWQRFFDEVADRGPLVLIFEDLHWADPAMLAFIQYLAEWSTGVAMLVVCTARPELLEEHPEWAGGLANATTLALRALATEDTERLARSLLRDLPILADVQQRLVERCGGNPLYAEEYARLLGERAGLALPEVEMPDTVVALIAARLDTLDAHRKALLHDAAVVGKVFWAGAVAAMGDRDAAPLRADLHDLSRKELIRRSRISTVPGDEEYAFWHDLVHEVAYRQIPRAERADRHRRAAEWIEQMAGDRAVDRAELLAHHYQRALELVRASSGGDPEPLRRSAVHHLTVAGTRALGIDVQHAEELIRRGLEVSREIDPERGRLLCLHGEALFSLGRHADARSILDHAARAAEATNDVQTMGTALVVAFESAWMMGDTKEARRLLDTAVQSLRSEPPTDRLSLALGWRGCLNQLDDDYERALPDIEEAIAVGEAVGDRFALALALMWRGMYRALTGESDGAEDYTRASAMLSELGSSLAPQGPHNAASGALLWHGPKASKALYLEAVEYARRIHVSAWERQALAELPWALFDLGEWDELLRIADEVVRRSEGEAAYAPVLALPPKARVLALRGATHEARETIGQMLDHARTIGESQATAPALAAAALVEYLDGRVENTLSLIDELLAVRVLVYTPVAEVGRILLELGRDDLARAMIQRIRPVPRSLHEAASVQAWLAEREAEWCSAHERWSDAVAAWRSFGNPLELAHAVTGLGRTESRLGRATDAHEHFLEAETIFKRLGVTEAARTPMLEVDS